MLKVQAGISHGLKLSLLPKLPPVPSGLSREEPVTLITSDSAQPELRSWQVFLSQTQWVLWVDSPFTGWTHSYV